jgi:hypothetical protein
MKISLVLVSYNTKKLLNECLRSIFLDGKNCQVIVVDNASSDGSIKMIKEKYPQVRLLVNYKNLGFGKANNLGAKEAQGEIIFFLNSDTLVPKGTLSKLGKFFDDHLRAGIVGPKIVLKDGETQPYSFGDDPTIFNLVKDKLFDHRSPIRTKRVDWITGAALAIRRDLFEEINGFDENIFMYFEDNDLCLRARKIGQGVYLDTEIEIIHLGGMSAADNRTKKDIYFQSQDYFFKKHYGLSGIILLKLIRLPYKWLKN